jgi:asparagine synthase (glutamine-hydrolysing)
MCGIVATVGTANTSALKIMLDAVEHRGRDGSNMWDNGFIGLGSTRLAIVGGPEGTQPLTDETGLIYVVGNAEIYNHEQLRAELGTQFKTGSDVEVIAHAWAEWGSACLPLLHGMFAFVLFDARDGTWYAARDGLGIKPLWYAHDGPISPDTMTGGKWWFASEAQAIHAAADYGVDPKKIRKVPPGSYVNWTGVHRWNTPELHPGSTPVDPSLTRHVMAASVKRHLMTDPAIRTCAFLSGGIDSSAITALAAEYVPDLTAFTVGIPGRSSDIEAAIKVMDHLRVRHPGVRHVIVPFDVDAAWGLVPWAVRRAASYNPMIIEELLVQLQLATAARDDGFRVALTADGFDELLGGYGVWHGIDPDVARAQMLTALAQIGDTEAFRLDLATMLAGDAETGGPGPIEARTPILTDPYVVQHFLGLPTWALLHPNADGTVTRKWIIREAMRPLLPSEIVDRVKVTFGQGADASLSLIARMAENCDAEEMAFLAEQYPDAKIQSRAQGYLYRLFHQLYGVPGQRSVMGGTQVFAEYGSYPALDRAVLTERHIHGGTGERATTQVVR